MSNPKDFEQELKALHLTYAEELPAKIASLMTSWQAFKAQGCELTFKAIFRNVHSLVGSGATFGFLSVSAVALELQNTLEQYLITAKVSKQSEREIDVLMVKLKSVAQQTIDLDLKMALPLTYESKLGKQKPLVFLMSTDAAFVASLATELGNHSIRIRALDSSANLLALIQEDQPAAILVRNEGEVNPVSSISAIASIIKPLPQCPYLGFISANDGIEDRLAALRAGAAAYFLEPINSSEILNSLQSTVCNADNKPYRVLIIDDDEIVAHHNALILQRAGMETCVITDPMSTLELLMLMQPELILLDVNMPNCSGLELAAVIRQQCVYTGTAIVFFSAETDIDRHIDALRLGGDEFLVKPMEPKRLVAAIEARVKRTRVLRNQLMLDGLTGVLNRSVFENYLRREYSRSVRGNQPFCYVLLDLDKFKLVNDTYGHFLGDEVLKALTALLTKRLRAIDIIGRYGGEEFCIILPYTRLEQAEIVINQLLIGFSLLKFSAETRAFKCTFSAGIAEFPGYEKLDELIKAADTALYRAKEQGRNQLCLAP